MEQCRVSQDELRFDRKNMAAELNHVNTCIGCNSRVHDDDVKHDAEFWRGVPSSTKGPCICNDCSEVHAVKVKWGLDDL
jgi:hypothetical protein